MISADNLYKASTLIKVFQEAGIPHTYSKGFGELNDDFWHACEVMSDKQFKRFFALAKTKQTDEIIRSIKELKDYQVIEGKENNA